MTIETNLNRIADALERIAETLNATSGRQANAGKVLSDGEVQDRREAAMEGSTQGEAPPEKKPEAAPEPLDRDGIKAQLTALGVEFNNRAATTTLAAKLEEVESETRKTPPSDESGWITGNSQPEKQAPEYDLDTVREALISFAENHPKGFVEGQIIVTKLVEEHARVRKLSMAPVESYPLIMAALEKEKEAANG